MALISIGFLFLTLTILIECSAMPGHHHVHHRIYVPAKIKTIYHTKIIKVPEHHHHFHEKEKEKIVKVPEHHHYFHEKEKEKVVDLHEIHDDIGHDHDFDVHKHYDFEASHSIYKKHAPATAYRAKKKTPLIQRKDASS